jgi:hypothetical protein
MTDLGFFSVSDASLAIQTCRRLNSSPVMQSNFVDVLLKRYPRFTDAGGSNLMFFKLDGDMLGNTALARRCDSDGVLLDPSSVAVSVQAEWNRPLGAKADYFGLFYKRSGGWTFLQGPCLDNSCDLEDSNINLDSPPEGAVNEEYEHTIIATNLAGNMTITGLPPGLTFNGSTGVISGTPTQEGIFTVIVSGTSAENECPITRAFNLVINPCDVGDAFIDPDDPPDGAEGEEYNHTILFGDVTNLQVLGLPAGLVFDPETGDITGTPAEGSEGIYFVTITALTEPNNCPIEQIFRLIIGECDPEDAFLFFSYWFDFLDDSQPAVYIRIFAQGIKEPIEFEAAYCCEITSLVPVVEQTCDFDTPIFGIVVDSEQEQSTEALVLNSEERTLIGSYPTCERVKILNPEAGKCDSMILFFTARTEANDCLIRAAISLAVIPCPCPDPDEIECEDAWLIECDTPVLEPFWFVGTPESWTPETFNATITSATGLPPGLTLSGGTVSGTPTTAGTYNVRFCGTIDSGEFEGCEICKERSITVS